jgi:hypothetical protein
LPLGCCSRRWCACSSCRVKEGGLKAMFSLSSRCRPLPLLPWSPRLSAQLHEEAPRVTMRMHFIRARSAPTIFSISCIVGAVQRSGKAGGVNVGWLQPTAGGTQTEISSSLRGAGIKASEAGNSQNYMKLTPQWPQELSASDRAHLKGEVERLNKEMEKKKVRSRFENSLPQFHPAIISPHIKRGCQHNSFGRNEFRKPGGHGVGSEGMKKTED